MNEEACNGCQRCVDNCPADVFAFDTTAKVAVVKYGDDCFACLLCLEDCPTDAIAVETRVTASGYRSIYDRIGTWRPEYLKSTETG